MRLEAIPSYTFSELPLKAWQDKLTTLRRARKKVIEIPPNGNTEQPSHDDTLVFTTRAYYCSAGAAFVPDKRGGVLFHYKPISPEQPQDQLPWLLKTTEPIIGGVIGGDLYQQNTTTYDRLGLRRIRPGIAQPNSEFNILLDPVEKVCHWSFQPYYDWI
jgi:hypothetical protein